MTQIQLLSFTFIGIVFLLANVVVNSAQSVDMASEINLPGNDIAGNRCNPGSVGCECLSGQPDGVRCGYLASCRADSRDGGVERCVLE
jgi:hypothetical protein